MSSLNPSLSEKQMIWESYIMMHTLKERADKHSIEYRDMFEKISEEQSQKFDKICSKIDVLREENKDRDERITKIETERNWNNRIMTPVISAIVSFVTGVVSRKV